MLDTNLICKAIALEPDHATNNKFRFESVDVKAETLEEQQRELKNWQGLVWIYTQIQKLKNKLE